MAEVKKDSSLGDSCGSDGSLSKDLSHQAELNFVSQGVNLAFEDEILLESSELPQGEKYENENVVEFARPSSVDLSKEMEIAAKYIEATEMSDAMEQDCDSDDALMFCENCKGPITKMKKFDNTGKQFCSKQCADSQNKAQNLNEEKAENIVANRGMSPQLMTDLQDVLGNNQFGSKTSSPSGKETEGKEGNNSLPPDFDWRKYRNMLVDQAAPASCFGKLSKGVKGLKPGMKLEALDKNDPCNYCIATVIDVIGHRVRIRYDGFGNDDSRDFWCNFQAEELFPIGWCAENSYPLQPPAGITSTLEDWKTFLTKTLTGALAAPMDLFKENENRSQPNVHSFQAGARVECIHPKRPSIICPGTVSRILGPYGYEITTEPLPHLPAHVFYGNTESTGIFEFGWTMKNGIDLALPAYVDGSGLSKDKYIASCKSRSAPPLDLYKKTTNNFKIDQKLEAVDLEEPSVIRVATVFNIVGRVLHLLFDGQRKFQYVDCESDDIYPIDWCMKTGHPLSTPYGLDATSQATGSMQSCSSTPPGDTLITSLCAELLTKYNTPRPTQRYRKPFHESTKASHGCPRRRKRQPDSCCDDCDEENEAESSTCRCRSSSIMNRSSSNSTMSRLSPVNSFENDSDQDAKHSYLEDHFDRCCSHSYIGNCKYHRPRRSHCYVSCCSRAKHKRHSQCTILSRCHRSFVELSDSSDECEVRNCFSSRDAGCLRARGKKRLCRREEQDRTDIVEVVNKVQADLTSAVESINLSIQQLTKKLNVIEGKLLENTKVNRNSNDYIQLGGSSKKHKRVTRGCQVNPSEVGIGEKTRTKSLLQKRFSSFKLRRNELHSKRGLNNRLGYHSDPIEMAPNVMHIANRGPVAVSLSSAQNSVDGMSSMAMSAVNAANVPTLVNQMGQKPAYRDQNGVWTPFDSAILEPTDQHVVTVNKGLVNTSGDMNKFKDLPTFIDAAEIEAVALNSVGIKPITETSIPIKSDVPSVHIQNDVYKDGLLSPKSSNSVTHNDQPSSRTWDNADEQILVVPYSDSTVESIIAELPPDKALAIKNMVSNSTMQRYEFSLKLLDLFFSEEEQAQDITNGGGILRNLDPTRVENLKIYPTMADIAVEPEQMTEEAVNNGRSMTLPSFQNVLKKEEVNKKIRAKLDGSILSPSNENASQLSKDPERKTEEQDKVEETHCVFFNKSCLIGPYLDPEKVANMPEFTAFGKPPAAIKFALEHVIEATIAPMDAMDAIQEGFCPKLFSKGKRKILKKGLFRFDTKLRAGRFLKRLCKKLKSCEYFLSFDPAKDPCPLECQVSGTTSLESFMAMRGMKAKGTLIVKRGRPRKDEFELQKPESHNIGEFGSSKEDWPANIKHTLGMPVRVMNPTSYHGRPLVPIAPGSKVNQSPVTIVPAGSQLRHLRPPPPYELDGRASLVQSTPTNTTVTSSTQPRMVTPVSLRMFSPTTPTAVLPAGDSSTANFPTQNLATVLVVTNPHSTSQAGPGVFSLRGTVPHHGLRLPSSTNSRKLSVGSRMKSPGPIKIHGPMIDQLPGVMNPMSPKHRLSFPPSQKIDSPVASYHKLQQAIRIPSPQNTSSSSYDKDTKVMLDYDRYRESRNYEHIAPSPGHQFIKIQKKPDIKLEPQEHQHYPGSNNNHNQALPTVRIHHPASSTFHSRPDELQMRSNSVDMLNLIPDRMISDNSHSPSNLTSPARQEFTMTRFEIGPHQNRHSHSQSSRTHMPVGQSQSQVGQNQLRQSQMGQNQISPNHLHVSTSVDDSQSALSPMHSPPPLRPAPSNQHRSIALRSPPNLTPSTVLSHFDFSPVSTNTVISQPGHLYRQQNTQVIDSSNGRLPAIEIKNVTSVNHGPKNAPSSTTNMVTFTYIPVQTQANEKLVYVPINQHFNNDRHKHRYQPQQQQQQQQNHQHQQQQQPDQQSVILYSNQRKQNHQFSRPFSDVGSPLPIDQALSDKKIPLSPLDLSSDSNNGPYSGITRKFTVRTLQRAQGPLASSLTTVRLQGPNVTEGDAQNAVDNQTSPFNMSNVKFANRNDGRRLGPMENNFTSVISTVNTPSSERSPSVASRENHADNQSEPNLNYDEVSDYEDDMDYEEFDDGNEANYDDDGVVDDSKSPGFRGRKRGKQKFFVRKKGNANHHYKLKYKQALEQAKVMRERRPSFVPSSLHSEGMEHCEKQSPPDNSILNQQSKESEKATFVSNDTSAASPSMSQNTAEIKPNIESTSYRLEMVGQNNTENPAQYSLSQFSNGFENNVDLNLKEEIVDNTPNGGEAFAPTSGSPTVLQSSPVKKGKVDGKAQRRKRKGNNSFENDFFYGQWTLSQDGSNKKKKRNSTSSSLSPTQYLADPLERVKLPSNPETWSEGQVASFIGATECSQYADTLKDQEIDGSALLLLTRESLMEFTGMKLGPALKICGYVAHLKGRMRMHQNIAVIQS